ncbi:helix-hairpin-helix domain-containing protein [Sphaerotilus sp.]|uniref:helix-hairpin-helix domain-containing protein n=1 Tax=Sphaerotilus sp. TaxID=2093942 RepID=UPI002ACD7786|nr:helix-hairpin-helix domain-containing protein [Sphaerotilus sp.]MDZ7856409.1 helix-hairpin-helix domain-containing protein [Sphaerotilus sp.]
MTFPETDTLRRDAAVPSLADLYAEMFAAAMTPWTWASVWWQPWPVLDIRLGVISGDPAPGDRPTSASATDAAVIEVVPVVVSEGAATVADDLTRIEGIGPKLALQLGEAGITTFAALAATSVERLEALIAAAGARFKLARPQTWPEQAALLAAGDEAGFAALAARLKGGVRV